MYHFCQNVIKINEPNVLFIIEYPCSVLDEISFRTSEQKIVPYWKVDDTLNVDDLSLIEAVGFQFYIL